MDITGHSRIKGLTLEQAMDKKHCPHYAPKAGAKPARRPQIPVDHTNARIRELPANYPAPRIDWNLARQLYDEGLNDCQIAAKLHCHEASVMEWRKKNGLIAQKYRRAGNEN